MSWAASRLGSFLVTTGEESRQLLKPSWIVSCHPRPLTTPVHLCVLMTSRDLFHVDAASAGGGQLRPTFFDGFRMTQVDVDLLSNCLLFTLWLRCFIINPHGGRGVNGVH